MKNELYRLLDREEAGMSALYNFQHTPWSENCEFCVQLKERGDALITELEAEVETAKVVIAAGYKIEQENLLRAKSAEAALADYKCALDMAEKGLHDLELRLVRLESRLLKEQACRKAAEALAQEEKDWHEKAEAELTEEYVREELSIKRAEKAEAILLGEDVTVADYRNMQDELKMLKEKCEKCPICNPGQPNLCTGVDEAWAKWETK
jgi:hypothetical protein